MSDNGTIFTLEYPGYQLPLEWRWRIPWLQPTRSSWVEQTRPASILASGIGVLSISTWHDQMLKVA